MIARPHPHGPAHSSSRVYDALVVGGGPVGGQTARHLASRGHDVLLVEEHTKVGEPVQCAGLFTPRIFDLVDFPVSDVFLNNVRGANVHSPGGHTISLDGGQTMAVAIDRGEFDRKCVESAERAGATILKPARVVGATRDAEGVTVSIRHADGSITRERTRLLIGADGVQSSVAKWFGIPRAREIVPCYGAQVEGTKLTPTHVEMWVGQERAPGFFSWMIPTSPDGSEGKVEVGVDIKAAHGAKHYYDRMWKDDASARFLRPDAKACFDICGCIPLGPIKKTHAERVAVVGDAGAQTKPTSGGGVYTGLVCAGHLADVADLALEEDDLSEKRLSEYHDRWYADVGRELYVGWRLRKAFMHLRDDQVEDLFHLLDDRELLGMVNALGDIDYPSKLAKPLLKKAPHLFKYSGAFVKSLFD